MVSPRQVCRVECIFGYLSVAQCPWKPYEMEIISFQLRGSLGSEGLVIVVVGPFRFVFVPFRILFNFERKGRKELKIVTLEATNKDTRQ